MSGGAGERGWSGGAGAGARGGGRSWVQWCGLVVSVAVLGWCVYLVVSDQGRMGQVRRLAESPGTLALMVGVSGLMMVCSGMMFHALVRPVARVPVVDVLAVNAVSTLLNNVPFKLSLVARFYLHGTRNGMPVALVLAWMGAALGVMVVSVAGPVIATLAVGVVDGVWWAVAVGATAALGACAVAFSRWTAGDWFWDGLGSLGRRFPRVLGWLATWSGMEEIRKGPLMLGNWSAVAQGLAWRAASTGLGVWRFALAAGSAGVVMTAGQCVIADSTYFAIQAAAPTGALGAREGGTVAALAAAAGEQLPVVVLAVSAAETVANLALGLLAAVYLRVTRGRNAQPASPGAPPV